MASESVFCYLLYAGTPIGLVRLTHEPLSAGWLHPVPTYSQIRLTLQVACAAIRGAGFNEHAPAIRDAVASAEGVKAQLGLMTDSGGVLQPESIDIWDDPAQPGAPFVLVHFRGLPGSTAASLPPKTRRGDSADDLDS
jgi:hypothetical protein